MSKTSVYEFAETGKQIKLIELASAEVTKVNAIKTLDLLKVFVVDEANEQIKEKNEKAITEIHKSIRSLEKIFDTVPEVTKSSLMSHPFIGNDQWNFLTELLTFSDNELNLLHSVFMLFQYKGSLSPSRFWKIMRYLHNISGMTFDYHTPSLSSKASSTNASECHAVSPPSRSIDESFCTYIEDIDNEICMAKLMNEKSIYGKLFFDQLDVYKVGSLSFFEFALALSIFCKKSKTLEIFQIVFDSLDIFNEELIYYEKIAPILDTMPICVHDAFYECFKQLGKNYMTSFEFCIFWDLNFCPPFINFFALEFEDVCYKFGKL